MAAPVGAALPHPESAGPSPSLGGHSEIAPGVGDSVAVLLASAEPPRQRGACLAGKAVRLKLPSFTVSGAKRDGARVDLSFSELSQMNAILYSRLGVVIERDVLAAGRDESFCKSRGLNARESLASFVGLYWGRASEMAMAVAALVSHRACGLVVMPPDPDLNDVLLVYASGAEKRWVEVARDERYAKLTFALSGGRTAVFVVFDGCCWKMKSKQRPGKKFDIFEVDTPGESVLGIVPAGLTRPSPVVESLAPSPSQDSAPCSGPQRAGRGPALPRPPSKWNVALVQQWAASYPEPLVGRLAAQAVGPGVDPGFVGSLVKSVIRPNPQCIRGQEEAVREQLLKECAAGRIAGPFNEPPFRFFRNCPLRMIPKEKHVPESKEMRLISNFSAGRFSAHARSSVNDLCATPGLVGFHLRPHHLRDLIASKGRRASVWAADIPKCFRGQRNREELLPLFVYALESEKRGKEFFVDLCNPFGWAPSEYSWQCVLAVLLWRFRQAGVMQLLAYVDNFFRIFSPDEDSVREVKAVRSLLRQAGVPLHEVQEGSSFKGLGWLWDIRSMTMTCPEDKHRSISALLKEWSARVPLKMSLAEVRSLAGFMVYMSAAFSWGGALVSEVVALRSKLEAVAKCSGLDDEAVTGTVKDGALEALRFWAERFPAWDRTAPIMLGFSSASSWEVLGQSDASTEWGCGGIIFDGTSLRGYARPWSDAERAEAFVTERESTTFFELLGALEWFRRFGRRCKGKRCQLELDNAASVVALTKMFSPRLALLRVVRAVREQLFVSEACVRVVHVLGRFIAIADRLSHNQVEEARCLAREEFSMPLVMV